MTIKDLQNQGYELLQFDGDIMEIKGEYPKAQRFDGIMLKIENGDYAGIYGYRGFMPLDETEVYQIV